MNKLFILVGVLFLSGCYTFIVPSKYEKALEVCEVNGGLVKMWSKGDDMYGTVQCKNGAEFRIKSNDDMKTWEVY